MRHVSVEIGPDGIATLVMDNADESMNFVSQAWLEEMEEAVSDLAADNAVTGVILTSAKDTFMAGADLKMLVQAYGRMSKSEAFLFSQRASMMHRAIEQSGKPWVAAINGLALGGGFELALACHHRVLADRPRSLVGFPEVTVGLLPGSGGTQRLARMAGIKVALDLLLSGRHVAPSEALALGIVNSVVSADALISTSRSWLGSGPRSVKPWDAKSFSSAGTSGLLDAESAAVYSATVAGISAKGGRLLPALPAILSCVFEGLQLPFDAALVMESKYFATLLTDPVARNIIRTTFLSKAAAEKGARRPANYPKYGFRLIGVLGAGMMGSGIALVSALAGIRVVLLDRDIPMAIRGKEYAEKVLSRDVEKGRMTRNSADAVLARIVTTDSYDQLKDCDLVIEAVFEDRQLKADVTAQAERVIPSTALFATNTSTLPITGLAEASERPDQFIGLHFFSPVERMGLVEVIRGRGTSDETLAKALDYVAQIRKTPIVVNDSRGFYTSRVFQTLIHEGAAMLLEGVPAAVVENAAKQIGLAVGPLTVLDEVGFDLPLKIVEQALAAEGDRYSAPRGVHTLTKMRDELGRGGRKSGGGFYNYPEGGKKHLWKALAEHFPPNETYDFEDVKKRLLYAQAVETARCLEEGVLETPEDADLGAIYGWNFPTWTGGPISFIDTIGIRIFVREADRLAQLYGAHFAPSAWLREKADRGESFYQVTSRPSVEPLCAA